VNPPCRAVAIASIPVASWPIEVIDDYRRLRELATRSPASGRANAAIYADADVPASLARRLSAAWSLGRHIQPPIRQGGSPDRRVERGEVAS
jgi:hypothetical protein